MGTGKSGLPKGVRDVTHKLLGAKVEPLFKRIPDLQTALSIVNPKYDPKNKDYSQNCALCVSAAALQLLGYDVEAMPRSQTWRGFDSIFDYKWTPENFKSPKSTFTNYAGVPFDENFKNTNRFKGITTADMSKEIRTQMQTWGPNSFAAMNVSWKNGGAHVVIVHQSKLQTSIMDFQTHRSYTVGGWMAAHPHAKLETIGLYRLDNQKIRDDIPNLDKIVKKRG